MTNGQIITTGGAGAAASFGAWWVSHLPVLNGTAQFVVLSLGGVVSLLSLRKLLRKGKSK